MNRRYSTLRRKRQLHFLEQILEETHETTSPNTHAAGDTTGNDKGHNNDNIDKVEGEISSDFEEWKARFDKDIQGEDRHDGNGDNNENKNDIHDRDVRFYLDMFGLKQFTVDDSSEAITEAEKTTRSENDDTCNLNDNKEYGMDDESLADDWDIIEIDVFGASESPEKVTIDRTELDDLDRNFEEEESMAIDIYTDDISLENDQIRDTREHTSNRILTEIKFSERETIVDHHRGDKIDDHIVVDDDGEEEGDDENDCGQDSDDDSDDNYSDDEYNECEDDDSDSDSDTDSDGNYDCHQDDDIILDANRRDTARVDEGQNYKTDAERIKEKSKQRHKDVEKRIRRHIEEIEHKMKVLKRKERRKRKRCTYCRHSGDIADFQPQLNIKPIQRSKRLAEPIRHAILKRHALRSAWAGFKGSCCGKGCWSRWKWVNIKRVLSDYW